MLFGFLCTQMGQEFEFSTRTRQFCIVWTLCGVIILTVVMYNIQLSISCRLRKVQRKLLVLHINYTVTRNSYPKFTTFKSQTIHATITLSGQKVHTSVYSSLLSEVWKVILQKLTYKHVTMNSYL